MYFSKQQILGKIEAESVDTDALSASFLEVGGVAQWRIAFACRGHWCAALTSAAPGFILCHVAIFRAAGALLLLGTQHALRRQS